MTKIFTLIVLIMLGIVSGPQYAATPSNTIPSLLSNSKGYSSPFYLVLSTLQHNNMEECEKFTVPPKMEAQKSTKS